MTNSTRLLDAMFTAKNLKRIRIGLRIIRHISIVLFVALVLSIEFLWHFLQWLNTVIRPEVERIGK